MRGSTSVLERPVVKSAKPTGLDTIPRKCDGCPLRADIKVPGYGLVENPVIMFVAEAPGENELKTGKPLIGKTGSFLRQILNDLGLPDTKCYYSNTCMCKPPKNAVGNKDQPTAEMVKACSAGLENEIDTVHPRLLVPLGDIAAKAIGKYERGITSVRGMYRELELADGSRVGILPTFHPSAVMRDPDKFRDFERDLRRAVEIAHEGKPAVIPPPVSNYEIVTTQTHLDAVWPKLESARILAVDLETVSRNFMTGSILDIGFGYERGQACSIAWDLIEGNRRNSARMKTLLATRPISMQTASFDVPWLTYRGFEVNLKWDTEIAHWLLDERMGGHSLDAQAIQYYDAPPYKQRFRKRWGIPPYVNDEIEFEKLWSAIPDYPRRKYNATDCDYTWRLTVDLMPEIKSQGMMKLMKLLVEATMLYAELYVQGMAVDIDYINKLEAKLKKDAKKAEEDVARLAPGVNVRSPKQLAAFLFDHLKLDPFGVQADNRAIPEDVISASIRNVADPEARDYWQGARIALYEGAGTKSEGRGLRSRSTSTFMLYWLAQQHDFPRALIHYKKAQKSIVTYITNVKKFMWKEDGKIRPDYKLDGTKHGRFKTSRPAIHNLTAGPELYDMFVAPYPDWIILHADYSQADMRMMAHFSQDMRLVEWLKTDPHTAVVKEIGNFTDKDIARMKAEDPENLRKRRMAAKMVNFGLPYGRSAANLAPQMQMSVLEAEAYIREYWRKLPDLKAWMDSREQYLMDNGQELVSPFGNKRRFPLITDRSHRRECARLAVNFPIMSSVNYLTTLAHIRVVKALRKAGIDTWVYPHIHDSINVAIPKSRLQEAIPIVAEIMHRVPDYIGVEVVDFPVKIEAGYRWGTQDTVYEG